MVFMLLEDSMSPNLLTQLICPIFFLLLAQVAVPEHVAKVLTYPERVRNILV